MAVGFRLIVQVLQVFGIPHGQYSLQSLHLPAKFRPLLEKDQDALPDFLEELGRQHSVQEFSSPLQFLH